MSKRASAEHLLEVQQAFLFCSCVLMCASVVLLGLQKGTGYRACCPALLLPLAAAVQRGAHAAVGSRSRKMGAVRGQASGLGALPCS